MTIDSSWKSWSVEEFIDRANWLGVSPKILAEVGDLTASVEQLEESLLLWKSLSAKDFFGLNNWDGLATAVMPSPEISGTLSLTLPCDLFWQCFAWNESKINIPLPESVIETEDCSVKSEDKKFTLDNFSQLF